MQSKSRRATSIWLILIGLLLSVIFISGAVTPQVQLGILALYVFTVLVGTGVMTSEEVRRRLPKRPELKINGSSRQSKRDKQVTTAARKAEERASQRPDFMGLFDLVDVGLIASDVNADGMKLSRGDFTLDAQGLQPYLVINADSTWANETVKVRFEIMDTKGQPQFVHEETVYLRDGQNDILSGNRLPLGGENDAAPGLWELRVSIEGGTAALHSFSIGPSLKARQRMFENEQANHRRERLVESDTDEDDDAPISLEDLLRGRD